MADPRPLALFLALSGVAALPACSMFGGAGRTTSQTSGTTGGPGLSYAVAPNYNSGAPAGMSQSTAPAPDTIRGVQQTASGARARRPAYAASSSSIA
jgi:hypothetical protein